MRIRMIETRIMSHDKDTANRYEVNQCYDLDDKLAHHLFRTGAAILEGQKLTREQLDKINRQLEWYKRERVND